ncbi:hypothetical protein OHR68_09880 [Spirillospora sp. NBC_00431]
MSAQPCTHEGAVPVTSGGETVAALCPLCDAQLPAEWLTCGHPAPVETTMFDQDRPEYYCIGCRTSFALVDEADGGMAS